MTQPKNLRAPGVAASTLRVFELSFGQTLWSRRSLFLGLLVGGPVVVAAALRFISILASSRGARFNGAMVARVDGEMLFGLMIWLMFVRVVVPVLGVFYGTALIADEVEDKTITYLFTRPIPRRSVLFGKYLAYLATTVLLIVPSIVVVYFLVVPIGRGRIGMAFPSLLADLAVIAVGLAAYGAVFAYIGARVKHPLVSGLVFAFGWEPAILLFPGYLKRATVAYYLQALVPHATPPQSAIGSLLQTLSDAPGLATSFVCLAAVVGVALSAAGRAVERREYVLEQ
jgi:ABC-type Na+ efflux pump permease subunit